MDGLYRTIAGKSFKSQWTYRSNAILNLISGVLMLFVQVAVWTSLYGQGVRTDSTLAQALTYTMLSTVLLKTIHINPGERIGNASYTGELGADMLRPVRLVGLHTSHALGEMMFSLLTYVLPLAILMAVTCGILPPASMGALIGFVITAALGAILQVLINLCIGYAAFWLTSNWFMSWFQEALMLLLGGTVVPIWFYPDALARLTQYLPFRYISYAPIELYLGRIPAQSLGGLIGMQLVWIAALLLIERLIWRAAQSKITVHGG